MTARLTRLALSAACLLAAAACDTVDSNRIPAYSVNLDLTNAGVWNVYGVHGYGEYAYFNKAKRIPSNFAYTSSSATGYGGVLLIYGLSGPLAYDRACPVEVDSDVTVSIDSDNLEAYCPTCGSRFNVFEAGGAPVSGDALTRGYGMQPLTVVASTAGGYRVTR